MLVNEQIKVMRWQFSSESKRNVSGKLIEFKEASFYVVISKEI